MPPKLHRFLEAMVHVCLALSASLSRTEQSNDWAYSGVNRRFRLCPTYGRYLVVPSALDEVDIRKVTNDGVLADSIQYGYSLSALPRNPLCVDFSRPSALRSINNSCVKLPAEA